MNSTEIATLRRRTLIRIASRRQKPGTGSLLHVLQELEAPSVAWPDLTQILDGVEWALVGAVAAARYMPERMTRDMDVLMREADSLGVTQRLENAGYRRNGRLSIVGWSWTAPDGTPVDIIEGNDSWLGEALSRAREVANEGQPPVLLMPYLVLTKLIASRVQDIADITRMLVMANGEQLNEVRTIVALHLPDAVEDLESLIELGKLEGL